MGPSWKEMFPWGSWAADNPGRSGTWSGWGLITVA